MLPLVMALAVSLAPCSPTAKTHYRWDLKTRTLDHYVSRPLTVQQLLGLVIPTGVPRAATKSVDPFEDRVWAIPLAYVRLVKVSPDDCDLHLELSANSQDGPRFIAEIPAAHRDDQLAGLAQLGLRTAGTRPHEFSTPVPVSVAGWGFFDLAHQCASHPRKGCHHGTFHVTTLAEIHPAVIGPPRTTRGRE